MGVPVPVTNEEFQDLLRRVEDGLRDIEQQARFLLDAADRTLTWLGPLGDGARSALERLARLILDLNQELAAFLLQPGVPWTLWSHGQDWAGEPVGGRVSGLVGLSTLNEAEVDDYWQGRAADAYRNSLDAQKSALAAIKPITDGIDDAVTNVGFAIVTFWLAVALIVADLAQALRTSASVAGTGAGAPVAAVAAAGSVAKALGLVLTAATILYVFLSEGPLANLRDLRQRLYDDTVFPRRHWPRSTNPVMADASVLDGTRSNWNLRY